MDETDLVQQTDEIYVYVKFLGEGSFGRVNLYRNATDNSLVVWKEIELKKLELKYRQEAFSEVEILSMLDHANIISYYKHFIGDDVLYIELQYAKAGTLASMINQRKKMNDFFDEETILWYLFQLTSAIEYIHDLGIMHRDIKALNIFFMQSGLLKLGDFGIAKILDPNIEYLKTVVGTLFYMSPEIIEGKKYNFKSDIWSVGCVTHEILTLKRVFDATNELKLALKISQCEINEIDSDIYSNELKSLVKRMLSKEPESRPSAKEILDHEMFNTKRCQFLDKIESLDTETKRFNSNIQIPTPIISSKLSECYTWGGGTRLPKQIDLFRNENAPLKVSLGRSHYAVLTVEKELFTWTASHGGSTKSYSKLGHGKSFGNTRIPKRVDVFSGVQIEKISCGEEMTCCLTSQGDVYVFGSNLYGCLGLGLDQDQHVYAPTRIDFFDKNNIKIKAISCGDYHVLALSQDNRVFTWGCGEYGRLGHGDEDDQAQPKEIKFDFKYKFKDVSTGSDYSFLITKEGRVLAFGNNEYNKLCLNEYAIGLKNSSDHKINLQDNSNIISQQLTPKLVRRLLSLNIFKICPGHDHTAMIDVYGRLFTFGCNKSGQLGVGDSKFRPCLNQVTSALSGHFVTNAACGDSYTICSTNQNLMFSWGNRKDGRLGLDTLFSSDNTPVCSPKPIFGSLYLVSEMCCKYWNSIIIAEKEIEAKTVRSISYVDYLKEAQVERNVESKCQDESDCNGDKFSQDTTCQKREFNFYNDDTDEVPEWLKKDLEDADFIPIDALEKSRTNQENTSSHLEQRDNSIKTLEEALRIIQCLKEENFKLKDENLKLKEKLDSLNN